MQSSTMRGALIAMLVLVVGSLAQARDLAVTENFDQSYAMSADGRVSLDNVNGDVSVSVWDSDEVRVQATKSASSQEVLDRLEIEVDATSSSVRIRTRYPSERNSGRHHGGESRVEYTLSVPRGASLDGFDLVNGNLTVDGVEGEIKVDSVNGALELRDVMGPIDASTVNGSVEVWAQRIRSDTDVELESVNGRIDLHLPSGIGAKVDAETVNGSIKNDFGLQVHKGKWVGSDMRGTIGGGGCDISLETVNGGIHVLAD